MPFDAVPLGAYETSPDAYVLTDSRGRVRMVNEAAGQLFECDPADAVGRRCWGVVGLQTPDGAPVRFPLPFGNPNMECASIVTRGLTLHPHIHLTT